MSIKTRQIKRYMCDWSTYFVQINFSIWVWEQDNKILTYLRSAAAAFKYPNRPHQCSSKLAQYLNDNESSRIISFFFQNFVSASGSSVRHAEAAAASFWTGFLSSVTCILFFTASNDVPRQ